MSRMLQPTKQTLRQTIAHAADTIAAKNTAIDELAARVDEAVEDGEQMCKRYFGAGMVVGLIFPAFLYFVVSPFAVVA